MSLAVCPQLSEILRRLAGAEHPAWLPGAWGHERGDPLASGGAGGVRPEFAAPDLYQDDLHLDALHIVACGLEHRELRGRSQIPPLPHRLRVRDSRGLRVGD